MLLRVVCIHLSLLLLFAEQLLNYKLVIACLLGIAQHLACFQVVNFMQESSGVYSVPEATVMLL